MSKTLTLTQLIKDAIAKKDISKLYEYKDICDRIHSTGEAYKGFNPSDLPKDEVYQEMVRTIESATDIITDNLESTIVETQRLAHRLTKLIPDLWMGSIPKETEIEPMKDAILMPKFDGCSFGARIKRVEANDKFTLDIAVTRGTTEGYETKKSDITAKFATISNRLLVALSSSKANSFEFGNNKLFGNVLQINIRGEIVLKQKTVESAPASIVAGKINGGMDVWNEFFENIEIVPFEIIRCFYSHTDRLDIYVPTQLETLQFFQEIGILSFPFEHANVLTKESLDFVKKTFDKFNANLNEPLDGVVYCPSIWKYPSITEQTKPKQYGKLAWKPSSEATTTLYAIDYTVARDGKFTFILTYEPVNINGKKYSHAKTATSRMMLLKGIGLGSTITVKLAGDINPLITEFVPSPEVKPYEFPEKCPFCKSKTILNLRGKTPTFSCTNPNCKEITKQKMINFLTNLSIKGIAERKLEKLKEITLESVDSTYLHPGQLKSVLMKTDTRTFLVALGMGGTQQVTKLLDKHKHINPLEKIHKNYDKLCEILPIDSDLFISEVLDYSYTILSD